MTSDPRRQGGRDPSRRTGQAPSNHAPKEDSRFERSALDRVRRGAPAAPPTADRLIRRFQSFELLVVLALFPLGSAYAAVVGLIEGIQHLPEASGAVPAVNGMWLPVALGVFRQVLELPVVALVCYLLWRSGEGMAAINLDCRRLRTDLALLLPVWIAVQVVPQTLGAHIVAWAHLGGFGLLPSPMPLSQGALTVVQLAEAVAAGVLEEVVVLGYLVRRLEQRGWQPSAVVAIAVAVRISYHVYYGWRIIPIVLWAFASVIAYRRVRRLLPFIVCHVAWDAAIPLQAFYRSFYADLALALLLAGLAASVRWARWVAVPVPHRAAVSGVVASRPSGRARPRGSRREIPSDR